MRKEHTALWKQRHRRQWGFVTICIFIIIAAIIIELWIPLPQWVRQKTGSISIYQELFSGLASMLGLAMAIIALIMSFVSTRAYGMLLTHFIMSRKPIRPLRFSWVMVGFIMMTVLFWFLIAYGKNKIAVSIFLVAVLLLIYLTVEVMKMVHSSQTVESEIRQYIIESRETGDIENLFHEIENSISAGNALAFQRDTTFARELLPLIIVQGARPEDLFIIRRLLFSIMHVANEAQFAKVSDILCLVVIALEAANKAGFKNVSTNWLEEIDAYELLGKADIRALMGATGERLLFRWQAALLKNVEGDATADKHEAMVAAEIYKALRHGPSPDREKALVGLLRDTLQLLSSNEIGKGIAEINYLSLCKVLFETNDCKLLNVLFGFDGIGVDFWVPICGRHGSFSFSRANVFLVEYLFYVAHYESDTIIEKEEKAFCEQLLNKVGPRFRSYMRSHYHKFSPSHFTQLGEDFCWFSKQMRRFERYSKFTYGMSLIKDVIFENVTLDFFAFGFAHSFFSAEEIQGALTLILHAAEMEGHVFSAFDRYVRKGVVEDYTYYCSVMGESLTIDIEQEYARLKVAITNLYCDKRVAQAKIDNERFVPKQKTREQQMTAVVQAVANAFCERFATYDEADAPSYTTRRVFSMDLTLNNGELPLREGDIGNFVKEALGCILGDSIRDNITLISESWEDATVKKFFESFSGVDANLLLGRENFRYDDVDRQKHAEMKERCDTIGGYNAWVDMYAAVNTHLIKVSIKNVRVEIETLNQTYIDEKIANKDAMTVNDYSIEIDEELAAEFLRYSRREVRVEVDMAIDCLAEIVGGGIAWVLPQIDVAT